MFKKYITYVSILLMTFVLIACSSSSAFQEDGKGEVITKEIQLNDDFTKVSAHAGWEVELIKSNQTRMIVKTEENILDLLRYKIKNGELSISVKKNVSIGHSKSRKIKVYYKEKLSGIKAASSASIYTKETLKPQHLNLKAGSSGSLDLKAETNDLNAQVSSSGSINLRGKTKRAKIKATSSGDFMGSEFTVSQTGEMRASSSGEINIKANTKTLSAEVSSSGRITLKGTSREFNAKASSSGTINAKNLQVNDAKAQSSSNGRIALDVTDSLKAEASSGSTITYHKAPQTTNFTKSSGGSIKQK